MTENLDEKEFYVKYQRKRDSKILKIVIIAFIITINKIFMKISS